MNRSRTARLAAGSSTSPTVPYATTLVYSTVKFTGSSAGMNRPISLVVKQAGASSPPATMPCARPSRAPWKKIAPAVSS